MSLLSPLFARLHSSEPEVIWDHPIKTKKIALTFDDGPTEPYTRQVLDILKKENVKATFFLLGKNMEKNPKLSQRALKESHELGNHTYTHPDVTTIDPKELRQEIARTEEIILRVTGQKTHLFRPPYGKHTEALFPFMNQLGYKTVFWSIDPVDWQKKRPQLTTQIIIDNAQPGSVVLLHDGVENPGNAFDRAQVVKQLPKVISALKKKGFEFVTISELLSSE